jgi:YHS domain-containing protein
MDNREECAPAGRRCEPMSRLLRRASAGLLCLAAVLLGGCGTLAATMRNSAGQEVMLLGFDPVAYFTQGMAARGKPQHQATTDDGKTYYFANALNQSLFVSDPLRYEPQYDGFCALQAAYGFKYGSNPTVWEIVDGRLFVFEEPSSKLLWDMDRELNIKHADEQWADLRKLPWRLALMKRAIFRVPYYRSREELEREWLARNPGKSLPKEDRGDGLQNFVQPPGWRAAIGRGQPALGYP